MQSFPKDAIYPQFEMKLFIDVSVVWKRKISTYSGPTLRRERNKEIKKGGAVGRAVASESRGPWFKSIDWQNFIMNIPIYC